MRRTCTKYYPLVLIVVGLTLMAVFAARAVAAPLPTIAQSRAIADAAWPSSPCAGKVAISWVHDLHGYADDGSLVRADGLATGIDLYSDGSTQLRSCDVQIDSRLVLDPRELCRTVVHEWGHLDGQRHTHNGGIMDPSGGAYAPCDAQTRRELAVDAIRDVLPAGGWTRRWAINCTPRVTRCTARAAGAKFTRHYDVNRRGQITIGGWSR